MDVAITVINVILLIALSFGSSLLFIWSLIIGATWWASGESKRWISVLGVIVLGVIAFFSWYGLGVLLHWWG